MTNLLLYAVYGFVCGSLFGLGLGLWIGLQFGIILLKKFVRETAISLLRRNIFDKTAEGET